jgi:hypothetical protein
LPWRRGAVGIASGTEYPGSNPTIYKENLAMLFLINLICFVCVLRKMYEGKGQKYFFNVLT